MILQPLAQALRDAQAQCFGTVFDAPLRESESGFSSPLPLKLARDLTIPVEEIAKKLERHLCERTSNRIWTSTPGFLNIEVPRSEWMKALNALLVRPPAPYPSPSLSGKTLQELRETLAKEVLAAIGGALSTPPGEVTSGLSLAAWETRVGRSEIGFVLMEAPLKDPVSLQGAAFQESLRAPLYFLRHTLVRLLHLENLAGEIPPLPEDLPVDSLEWGVMREVLKFPSVEAQAVATSDPGHLFRHALKLGHMFDELYWERRILLPEDRNDPLRIALARGARIVLGHVYNLVGLSTPLEL